MRLEQSFPVEAPIAAVWEALTDPQRVASCLPGAQLGEPGEDGSFHGTFKVKLGPTTAEYRGTLAIEERDDAGHRVVMRADGRDKRGQGGAKATIVSTLTDSGGATEVGVDTDYAITGRLASFSRSGMIQDISNRLLGEFASCLQERLGESEPGEGAASAGEAPASVDPDAPAASAPRSAGNGAASPPPPPRTTPPPSSEPFDAGDIVGDVLLDRVKATVPFALAGLLLGLAIGHRAGRR